MASKRACEIKAEFKKHGITIREWSREKNVSERTVYALLRGDNKGNYGKAHRIAILLGLKDGDMNEVR